MLSELKSVGTMLILFAQSLNPYCGGTCSRRTISTHSTGCITVLILIVVEHALGVEEINVSDRFWVLILIVVEHALGVSRKAIQYASENDVLILIVVEHALGVKKRI